jgi:hypothetical protein
MRYFSGVILPLFAAFVFLLSAQCQSFTIFRSFRSSEACVIQKISGSLCGTFEGATNSRTPALRFIPRNVRQVFVTIHGDENRHYEHEKKL